MTLRDDLLPVIWNVRSIPGEFGLHTHTVALELTTFSGSDTGDGSRTTSTTTLAENGGYPPKVRWLKQDELALGNLEQGTCKIGPITPDFSGGGTSIGALSAATLADAGTYHVVITGPQHPAGAKYRVVSTEAHSAFHYYLIATPVAPVTV